MIASPVHLVDGISLLISATRMHVFCPWNTNVNRAASKKHADVVQTLLDAGAEDFVTYCGNVLAARDFSGDPFKALFSLRKMTHYMSVR